MSPAKTPAERKADERQRHKEAGRTAVTVHVRPEYVPAVRALETELQRRERRQAGTAG
jgi:tRNA (Thr-GGU) A37 N-methylase